LLTPEFFVAAEFSNIGGTTFLHCAAVVSNAWRRVAGLSRFLTNRKIRLGGLFFFHRDA
jgi:hypothetical protein